MPTPRSHADVELLAKLVLGQLPVDEAERLAVEYADDSRLAELAEAVANSNDTLLDSLRNHQTMDDANADRLVGRLIARLKGSDASKSDASKLADPFGETGGYVSHTAVEAPMPEKLEYFKILKVLGQGGMGTVYLADDTRLGRKVALKTLKRELAANPSAKDRFLREARSAARLDHDHIIPIYYVGEGDGTPFLAMPFLKGEPLDDRLKREGAGDTDPANQFARAAGQRKPLPLPEALRIASEVALGLAVAHAQGLIHRDIKPANVWLESPKGRAKILDFGLARSQDEAVNLTASGAILGTPAYMAPEQARGKPIDARADLFSLGVMLYEMVTGQRPFTGGDTMAILTSLALDDPTPPNQLNPAISKELSDLILKLLEKAPEKRPADAGTVAEALVALQMRTSRPIVEAMPSSSPPSATAIDPWGGLDEEAPAAPPVVSRSKPAKQSVKTERPVPRAKKAVAAEPSEPRRGNGLKLVIAAAALFLIGGGFAAYKLVFETKDGTLTVEVDGDADVRFKNGELKIYDADGKEKYTLKPGQRSQAVSPGSYKVAVLSADGVKLETDKFEMTKAGKVTLRVTAYGPAVAKKNVPNVDLANDPVRRAAEWVCAVGNGDTYVYVKTDDRPNAAMVSKVEQLPPGKLTIQQVTLTNLPVGRPLPPELLNGLRSLPALRLDGEWVTDDVLDQLRALPALERLGIQAAPRLTDKGLAHLPAVGKLKELGLSRCPLITDRGVEHLTHITTLRDVSVGNSLLTDQSAALLAGMPELTSVGLSTGQIGDEGVKQLSTLRKLTELHLEGTRVTDAELALLKSMPLSWLDVASTKVTDAGLDHLRGILTLVHLYLGPDITDAGLGKLVDLPALGDLRLGGCKQVGDVGLEHLAKCKRLTALYLDKTSVTAAGVKKLAAALPQCTIIWDGGTIEPSSVPPSEWVQLFNGKDLAGWYVPPKGVGKWKVVDGAITCEGDGSYLHSERGDFGDFHLRAEVKINAAGNSGIYVRASMPVTPDGDYEAQITNLASQPHQTGSLYGLVKVSESPVPPDTWFTHEIIVQGKRIRVLVNGKTTVDYTEPRPGLRAAGHLALQHLDGNTRVQFRKIEIKEAAGAWFAEPAAPAADPVRRAAEWALSIGGNVHLEAGGQLHFVQAANDLPPGRFSVQAIGFPKTVTDDDLARLAPLTTITRLYLHHPKITGAGLVHLRPLTNLEFLNLNTSAVRGADLARLKDLPKLHTLLLQATAVGNDGMATLKALAALRWLDVGFTDVGDADLAHLKTRSDLETLSLAGTAVSDAGLAHLSGLSGLRSMDLKRTKVTAAGVKKLAAALPQCKIEWDGGAIEPKK